VTPGTAKADRLGDGTSRAGPGQPCSVAGVAGFRVGRGLGLSGGQPGFLLLVRLAVAPM